MFELNFDFEAHYPQSDLPDLVFDGFLVFLEPFLGFCQFPEGHLIILDDEYLHRVSRQNVRNLCVIWSNRFQVPGLIFRSLLRQQGHIFFAEKAMLVLPTRDGRNPEIRIRTRAGQSRNPKIPKISRIPYPEKFSGSGVTQRLTESHLPVAPH